MLIWYIVIGIATILIGWTIWRIIIWAKKQNEMFIAQMSAIEKNKKQYYRCPRCGAAFINTGHDHLPHCPNCNIWLNVSGVEPFSKEDMEQEAFEKKQQAYFESLDKNSPEYWLCVTVRLMKKGDYEEAKRLLEMIKKFPNLNKEYQDIVNTLLSEIKNGSHRYNLDLIKKHRDFH